MTERERLKDLIKHKSCFHEECIGKCAQCSNVGLDGEDIDILTDYLLANGVIVLPCKVGDTVYSIMYGHNIIECKVAQITIEPYASIGMSFRCYGGMAFDMRHFGETVFLTREEAEKALAERSKT